jgi:hypothetical protein
MYSFQAGDHCHDAGHVILGFWVRGDTAILAHGVRSSIVSRQSEVRITKLKEHHGEVAGGAVEILKRIAGIDAKIACGCWH